MFNTKTKLPMRLSKGSRLYKWGLTLFLTLKQDCLLWIGCLIISLMKYISWSIKYQRGLLSSMRYCRHSKMLLCISLQGGQKRISKLKAETDVQSNNVLFFESNRIKYYYLCESLLKVYPKLSYLHQIIEENLKRRIQDSIDIFCLI